MNIADIYASATRTLFAQTAFLRTVTYTRPATLTDGSSAEESTETSANCQAWTLGERFAVFDKTIREFMIRASELSAFTKPRKGDYLIDLDGNRYNVGAAKQAMGTLVWVIIAQKTIEHEDLGSVAVAHTSSEGLGDLTAHTSAEDFGPLYV